MSAVVAVERGLRSLLELVDGGQVQFADAFNIAEAHKPRFDGGKFFMSAVVVAVERGLRSLLELVDGGQV